MKLVKEKKGNVGNLRIYVDKEGLFFEGECETGFLFSNVATGILHLNWDEISVLSKIDSKKTEGNK